MSDYRKEQRDKRIEERLSNWMPKTRLGKMIKAGEVKSYDELVATGLQIKEPEIIDHLLPDLEYDLILIGQGKGKFGRGQRRAFRQTQKKTKDGYNITFTAMGVVGDGKSIIGVGRGDSGETVPSREKAYRNAKLNLFSIKRGCGSWECGCGGSHSIPFAVEGKCGSVSIKLIPAPKGVGLCVHDECQKILRLAGIRDVWSTTKGNTGTMINLVGALLDALKKLKTMRGAD